MGFFYFDESIHDRAGFVLGAFVYSAENMEAQVQQAICSVGLTPGIDEFKSRARMDESPLYQVLRDKLFSLLQLTKIGLIIIPRAERTYLGIEALRGLHKIISSNGLLDQSHTAFFDEGICLSGSNLCELGLPRVEALADQDSRTVGGLQLADLAARTLSVMLLEKLGLVTKTVKAGHNSGYDPDLDIGLGFEMWSTVRRQFFTQDQVDIDKPLLEGFTLDIASYALHIADSAPQKLRAAALSCFGTTYLGCIH